MRKQKKQSKHSSQNVDMVARREYAARLMEIQQQLEDFRDELCEYAQDRESTPDIKVIWRVADQLIGYTSRLDTIGSVLAGN